MSFFIKRHGGDILYGQSGDHLSIENIFTFNTEYNVKIVVRENVNYVKYSLSRIKLFFFHRNLLRYCVHINRVKFSKDKFLEHTYIYDLFMGMIFNFCRTILNDVFLCA